MSIITLQYVNSWISLELLAREDCAGCQVFFEKYLTVDIPSITDRLHDLFDCTPCEGDHTLDDYCKRLLQI